MLKRKLEILPAFDKRADDPEKNYGIHGAEMKFLVIGDKGAIQFVIYTNWHLKHVHNELIKKCTGGNRITDNFSFCILKPMPTDIGYHSPKPMYEDQTVITGKCSYLGDKPCYYDGSSLNATKYFNLMITEGHEALWKALEKRYSDTFESEEII